MIGPKRGTWTRLPEVDKNGSRAYAQGDVRVVITDEGSDEALGAVLPPTLSISLQHQPPHPPSPEVVRHVLRQFDCDGWEQWVQSPTATYYRAPRAKA